MPNPIRIGGWAGCAATGAAAKMLASKSSPARVGDPFIKSSQSDASTQ
jgi:hypothetical protein